VATELWARFGDVKNYVEPFFGSGAVLLGRPEQHHGNETINDLDGFVANFWRSVKLRPEETAEHADNPVNENDLHARHSWLVNHSDGLRARLEGDPEYCDPKIAGWWVWGLCCWIGSGWCSGKGPWRVEDGKLVHLGDNGRGVNRQLVGRLVPWFSALSNRLANVRVCSGDWSRVCGPSVTFKHGLTGVFLDPPYSAEAERDNTLYRKESLAVAHDVCRWAIEAGERPDMRIALCGYDDEHDMPGSWAVHEWSAGAGFGGQAKTRTENGKRERIWFSPACLGSRGQMELAL
jgi:DNA adenine methylase